MIAGITEVSGRLEVRAFTSKEDAEGHIIGWVWEKGGRWHAKPLRLVECEAADEQDAIRWVVSTALREEP